MPLAGFWIVALWAWFAIEPTIGSALIAAVASIANTVLLMRHERHVDERFDERRNVIVRGTADDPEAVIVTSEERRELADRRARPGKSAETRKKREHRRRDRRNDTL